MSKLKIIMYHYTRDIKNSRYPGIRGLDIRHFEEQINFLKANYTIVSMEQVIEAVKSKSDLPENAVLLTFDDGYIDNYIFAFPILDAANVQGSFFIPGKTFTSHRLLDVNKIHYILASADISKLTVDVKKSIDYYRGREYDMPSFEELFQEYAVANRFDDKEVIFIKRILQTVLPEKLRNLISSELFEKYVGISETQLAHELYMSREQIGTMKRHGMFIGIHGYDHYWLGNLSQEEMKKDISTALDVLDEFIDRKQWVMNYPYGSYNDEVLTYIKEQGACVGLTTQVKVADLGRDAVLELPRLDCNDFPPKSENYKNFD